MAKDPNERKKAVIEKLQEEFALNEFVIVGVNGDKEDLHVMFSPNLDSAGAGWLLMDALANVYAELSGDDVSVH